MELLLSCILLEDGVSILIIRGARNAALLLILIQRTYDFRYGDDMAGRTASLCIRRTTYWDPDVGKEVILRFEFLIHLVHLGYPGGLVV